MGLVVIVTVGLADKNVIVKSVMTKEINGSAHALVQLASVDNRDVAHWFVLGNITACNTIESSTIVKIRMANALFALQNGSKVLISDIEWNVAVSRGATWILNECTYFNVYADGF